jgi:hypothetical protein
MAAACFSVDNKAVLTENMLLHYTVLDDFKTYSITFKTFLAYSKFNESRSPNSDYDPTLTWTILT